MGGIRFDRTINLGHVLTIVAMLLAGLSAWTALQATIREQELRVAALERQATVVVAQVEAARAANTEQRERVVRLETYYEGVQAALADIRVKIDRLVNRSASSP